MTLVGYPDPLQGKIWLDTSRSSLVDDVVTGIQELSSPEVGEEQKIQLRVFLDGSVVQIFAEDAFALSGRIYPTLEESKDVFVAAEREDIGINSLSVWKLSDIWH